MEYMQISLDDWARMKEQIKAELVGVKRSFIRIGFALRKIEDNRLYKKDGYKSVSEFAKAEYGLEPTTVSRFMAINREYSIDGYSEHLRPEYAELGRSQLEEMLKLEDADRKMIRPETTRADIRELKQFNKEAPEEKVADDIEELVEHFFNENRETLNEIFADLPETAANSKRFAELVNPSGNRSYRKGLYFILMYEDKISVKKFGQNPREMSWDEFMQITLQIFGPLDAGGRTWEAYFGESVEEEPEAESQAETGSGEEDKQAEEAQREEAKPEEVEKDQPQIQPQKEEAEKEEQIFDAAAQPVEEATSQKEETEKGEAEEKEPGADAEERMTDSEIGEAGIIDISEIAPAQNRVNPDKQRLEEGSILAKNEEDGQRLKKGKVRLIDGNRLKKIFMAKGKDRLRLAEVINEIEMAPEVK